MREVVSNTPSPHLMPGLGGVAPWGVNTSASASLLDPSFPNREEGDTTVTREDSREQEGDGESPSAVALLPGHRPGVSLSAFAQRPFHGAHGDCESLPLPFSRKLSTSARAALNLLTAGVGRLPGVQILEADTPGSGLDSLPGHSMAFSKHPHLSRPRDNDHEAAWKWLRGPHEPGCAKGQTQLSPGCNSLLVLRAGAAGPPQCLWQGLRVAPAQPMHPWVTPKLLHHLSQGAFLDTPDGQGRCKLASLLNYEKCREV